MATTAFSAGNITLSGWVSEATSTTPSPLNSFIIGIGVPTFVFNWTANTNISNHPNDSPQIITAADGGSGNNASLQIVNTDSSVTIENGSGSTLLSGAGTYTVGGTGGEGFSQLQSDIQGLQLVDGVEDDQFNLKFTITDTTTATSSSPFYESFEVFNPCYTPGTRIATPNGEVPVEDLQIGDLVTTASGTAKPVKWVGRRSHSAETVAANRNLRPVLIRKGALGGALPRRDLVVSPMHAMFIDGALIPAAALVNGVSILRRETSGPIEYIHIELDRHDIVLAEGAPAETFLDDNDRSMFANASEYYDLYGMDEPRRAFCAPRLEEGYRLEHIWLRLATRANIARARARPGDLAGHVERFQGGVLEGWVMDHADPTAPVELEVLVGGEVAVTVLANRYRTDLDRAGLAGGRCGFTVELPSVTPLGQIEVRRAADARQVPMPVAVSALA